MSALPRRVLLLLLLVVMLLITPPITHAQQAVDQSAQNQDAREQLHKVMGDPMFSRWEQRQERIDPGDGEANTTLRELSNQWRQRIEKWFDRWLNRNRNNPPQQGAGHGSGSGSGSIGPFFRVLAWVILGLAALFLVWIIVGRVRDQRRAPTTVVQTEALASALQDGHALAAESETWVKHAQVLADEEDHRMAYRALYLALLSGLHSAGVIRYRAQRTNWRYVQGFKGQTSQRTTFAALTRHFDEIWYGQHEPDPATFNEVTHQVRTLLSQAATQEVAA